MIPVAEEKEGRRHWLIYVCYGVACGLIICFASIVVQFLLWLYPPLDMRGMVMVCALAALEAFFSHWLISRLPTAQRQTVYFRVTELGIILVALKLFTELRSGPASFWNNLLLWPIQFPFNILNIQYLLVLLPVLATWWSANLFAADLSLLGVEDASALDDRLKTTPIRTRILQRYLSLGSLVVILAGIPLQVVFHPIRMAASNPILAAIAYFILGIILLSLTRYITLETTWWQAQLEIPAQVPQRWFAYSALILAGLLLLVSLLPTNYDMGLFTTLNAVFNIIYQAMMVLYGLFLLVLSLITNLLARRTMESSQPIPQVTPPPPTIPPTAPSTINWELVKSVFLWGVLFVLVIMALRQYLAFNKEMAEEMRRFRPLRWLLTAWERFIASFKKANRSVGTFIQNSLNRLRSMRSASASPGEWDFINLRRLSARQKVIFYYLALVRRAREAGLPRQDAQTPYEYAHSLAVSLKEEEENLYAMTESFMEARYTRHDIPAKTARRTETIWETIRRVLRKIRRSNTEEKQNQS